MNKILLLLLSLQTQLVYTQDEDWRPVGTDPVYAMSGVALINGLIIVVHDNKRDFEGRIGIIRQSGDKIKYSPLKWPTDNLPIDLEALDKIPGSVTDLLAMDSQGKCYWLVLNPAKEKLAYNGFIQIPGIKSPTNLEGFGMMKVGNKVLGVWAHRGKTQNPGKIYWGWIEFEQRTVVPMDSLEITVDWPTEYVRHISDLKISEKGDCWISSDSDPGDDGPFASAVYRIGQFEARDNRINFSPVHNAKPAFKFDTRKVEGIELYEQGLILVTDDENFGGYFRKLLFK